MAGACASLGTAARTWWLDLDFARAAGGARDGRVAAEVASAADVSPSLTADSPAIEAVIDATGRLREGQVRRPQHRRAGLDDRDP
jgi:hypothetical protein